MLELQDLCLVMILVSSFKASHISSAPSLLVVMSLMVVCGEFMNILVDYVRSRAMPSSIDLSGIFMTSVCVCDLLNFLCWKDMACTIMRIPILVLSSALP